jgi:peroxiredoxin
MIRTAWTVGLAALIAAGASAQEPPARAEIGKPVKAFKLKDAMKDEETMVDLASFKGKSAVVLVWISEKCDITWRYEKRTGALQKEFGEKGVKFFAVWSSAADSAQSIRKYAESKNYAMPVLDDAKGELARHFGATVTPTYMVIDKEGLLRYRGACDDLQCSGAGYKSDETEAKDRYVAAALTSVLDGKEVAVTEKKGFG